MKVLTAEQMAYVDRLTIERETPGIDLMRRAGKSVFDVIRNIPGVDTSTGIVIVAGKGNNGGDGFRVAELLAKNGCRCQVFLLGKTGNTKGDAATCMNNAVAAGLSITEITGEGDLGAFSKALEDAAVVVDAIFGTGLKGEVTGLPAGVIDLINDSKATVVAVDIPSGVDASSGGISDSSIRADYTPTFGALKVGHVFPPGRFACGDVSVADIGFSEKIMNSIEPFALTLTADEAAELIPERAFDAHKGDCGRLFVVAGSVGLTGAAAMSSLAAMRVGAGLVTVGCPASLNDILEVKMTEVMTLPLPEVRKKRCLSLRALGKIRDIAGKSDVVAIGPGLGTYYETSGLVKRFLSSYDGKVVLDADGVNAFKGDIEGLASAPGDIVLTPHPGELANLTGANLRDIVNEPIVAAKSASASTGCIVLLKGAPTIIAAPSGAIRINSTGNEGMATAGMGDVLTGTIAGLAAQGLGMLDAAILGAYVHGFAGEMVSREKGIHGVMTVDVLESLPTAMLDIPGECP